MASKIEIARGDANVLRFFFPVDAWSAGGTLFFAAKPVVDDDNTDANAVINVNWDDTAIVGEVTKTIKGVATLCKQYNCTIPPSATNSINSNGADSADYLAEFQFVPLGGDPVTFPPNDPKLDCIVYFDIKRKVTP